MATPLSIVKERFESKDKLVEAVQELMTEELWLPRTSEDRKGKKDISSVSNAKLLRLHTVLSEVQKEFGSRAKLIAAILEVENRSKDGDYQKRLERYAAPRLLDQYKSSKRRGGYKGKPVSKTQDAAAPRPKPRPKAKAKAKPKAKAPAKIAKRGKKKKTSKR
jgi:hypothetical protein